MQKDWPIQKKHRDFNDGVQFNLSHIFIYNYLCSNDDEVVQIQEKRDDTAPFDSTLLRSDYFPGELFTFKINCLGNTSILLPHYP